MINSIQEIKVGRKYTSKQFPGALFLGCLEIDRATKFMLVLTDEEDVEPEGVCAGNKIDFSYMSFESYGFELVNE